MKNLLASTLVLSMFVAVPAALAADNDHRGEQGHGGPSASEHHSAPPSRGSGPARIERAPQAHHVDTNRQHSAPEHAARPVAPPHESSRGETMRHTNSGGGGSQHHHDGAQRDSSRDGTPRESSNSGENHDSRASHHYRDGAYNPPSGYQARHWGHGDRLPDGYYARNYWIGNFVAFGLFAPPSDLVWVRVGDDALLVNQESGEVVQVEYGVFY